jgi:2-oxoglutarate dehydrogenase complex dehydrogenase (E1) component-like enzyme
VLPELVRTVPGGVTLETVARPERSSPAEGYGSVHLAAQRRIVREALRGVRVRGPRREVRTVPWR